MPNIKVIISRRMRWVGDVAQMGERRGANRVWWEETGRKEATLRALGVDCRIILK